MLLDYLKNVVKEVADAGSITQTDLTVAVFGTSGRGNKMLIDSLFPYAVRKGLVCMTARGRSKIYTVTDAGRAYLTTQTF